MGAFNIIERFRAAFRQNSKFFLVTAANACAPAISLLAAPILTRLYSPADFGVFASFSAAVAIALPILSLRMEMAIPLPEKDSDAVALAKGAIRIAILTSVVATLIYYFAPFAKDAGGLPRWWLAPLLLSAALAQVLNVLAIRAGKMRELAASRFSQSFSAAGLQIGAGAAALGSFGLVCCQAIAQAISVIPLWRLLRTNERAPILPLLRKYEKFARVSSGPAFVGAFTVQLPVLAVAYLYGAVEAAMIAIIVRVVWTPISILQSSETQVLLSEAAALQRDGKDLREVIWRSTRRQCLLNAPILLATPLLPWLFPLLFGAQWQQAGYFALVFVPARVIQCILAPIHAIADVKERPDLHVLREFARFSSAAAAITLAVVMNNGIWPLVTLLSASIIFTAVFAFITTLRAACPAQSSVTRAVTATQ